MWRCRHRNVLWVRKGCGWTDIKVSPVHPKVPSSKFWKRFSSLHHVPHPLPKRKTPHPYPKENYTTPHHPKKQNTPPLPKSKSKHPTPYPKEKPTTPPPIQKQNTPPLPKRKLHRPTLYAKAKGTSPIQKQNNPPHPQPKSKIDESICHKALYCISSFLSRLKRCWSNISWHHRWFILIKKTNMLFKGTIKINWSIFKSFLHVLEVFHACVQCRGLKTCLFRIDKGFSLHFHSIWNDSYNCPVVK